jgi:alginate O-acetyltransferase complex protein AlgI
MLLSGIWHGAGLNFLVWGLWHGMLLAVHRGWSKWRDTHHVQPTRFGKYAAWAITFASVNLGWAFFCMDLPTAGYFLKRLFVG